MTSSRGRGRVYALPRIEALIADGRLSKSELTRRLRREVNELRTELRRAGFDVPLRYGGLGDPEKRQQIRECRQAGMTYAAIGARFGVTHQRIQQILKQMKP